MNKKTKQPLVSVIMPVHNGGEYIEEAIESILAQTYQRFELLIVDDVSTDHTKEVLKYYKKKYPKKIRLFKTDTKRGAFGAANVAFKKAKGKYIAPMDSDDIAYSKRLEKQVALLEEQSDVIVVSSHAQIIDEKGRVTGKKMYATDHEGIYRQYATIHPIVHPACMIRRSMLPERNYLYHTQYGVNSDYYTLFELLHRGKFVNIDQYLLKYRVHGKNSSLTNLKEKFFNITRIRFDATKNLGYRFPLSAVPVVLVQYMIALIVPERVLLPLYLSIRGMKKTSIATRLKFRVWKVPINLIRYAFALS